MSELPFEMLLAAFGLYYTEKDADALGKLLKEWAPRFDRICVERERAAFVAGFDEAYDGEKPNRWAEYEAIRLYPMPEEK